MTKKLITLLLILSSAFSACSRNAPSENGNDLADRLTKNFVTAFNSGEAGKLTELFTDDAVFIMCGWRMGGKDTIASGMKYLMQHLTDLEFTPGVSSVSGGILYITGLVNFSWKNEDYSALAKGIMTIIWKKQEDGSWKVTFEEENHGDLPEK